MQVADVGDVNLNLYNLEKACADIRRHFLSLIQNGCVPLALGGDHTMTYPILQAIKVRVLHRTLMLLRPDLTKD